MLSVQYGARRTEVYAHCFSPLDSLPHFSVRAKGPWGVWEQGKGEVSTSNWMWLPQRGLVLGLHCIATQMK